MFDDIIRDKANSHEAPVPPGTWDNIIKQRKKRRFVIFWWSSMLLLLGGLSVAGYLINRKQPPQSGIANLERNRIPAVKEMGDHKTVTTAAATPGSTGNSSLPAATTGTDNQLTAANADQQKTINGKITAVNTNNYNSTKPADKKSIKNNPTLLANSSPKKKKIKGKATYNSTPSEPIAATADDEKEQRITTEKNEHPVNTVGNNAAEKNTTIAVEKTLPAVTEKKKPAAGDIKNETITANKQPNKQHWYLDAGITPLLPLQQYNNDSATFNRTLFLNNNRSSFAGKLVQTSIDPSVAFSITARRTLGKQFTLGLGLQYVLLKEKISISGNETNTQYSVVNRLVNGPNGPELAEDTVAIFSTGTRTINAVNSYHLFSIPVFIQYNLVQKRSWSLSGIGGVYVNISSSYQNEINRNAAAPLTTAAVTGNTAMGYDLFAGLRLGKKAGTRVGFFALPSMRWNLGQYNIKNSLLRKTINQAGLTVGISYRVK